MSMMDIGVMGSADAYSVGFPVMVQAVPQAPFRLSLNRQFIVIQSRVGFLFIAGMYSFSSFP